MIDTNFLKQLIIFVGGAKGGVGKSLISMLLLHYFLKNGLDPILIETDTNNPDVYKSYKDACKTSAYDIDNDAGFGRMLDTLHQADCPVVINSGARNMNTLVKYGEIFNAFDNFTTLWLINHQLDSLNLLNEYLNLVQKPITVVQNGFFGRPEDFETFNSTNMRKSGISSVYLTKGPVSFMDFLYVKRKPVSAISEADFSARMMGETWLRKTMPVIEKALESAKTFTG